MFTKLWFKRVGERAFMTFFQTGTALYGADQFQWIDMDHLWILKTAGIAALLSIGTSLGKSSVGDPQNPGLE